MRRIRLLVTIAVIVYTAVVGWNFIEITDPVEEYAQTQEAIQLCLEQEAAIFTESVPNYLPHKPYATKITAQPHSSNHILYCGRKMVRCIMLMFRPPHLA